MRTECPHPTPYSPQQDYMSEKIRADRHLRSIVEQGKIHKGQYQHLGGVASWSQHLEKTFYGENRKVKDVLVKVLELMFYHEQSKQPIYRLFAEEQFMYAERLCQMITDAEDRTDAQCYLDRVEDYMNNL